MDTKIAEEEKLEVGKTCMRGMESEGRSLIMYQESAFLRFASVSARFAARGLYGPKILFVCQLNSISARINGREFTNPFIVPH
jgi:hypothetical protein